jgi:Fe-S cluster assembly scaffold protein SufB
MPTWRRLGVNGAAIELELPTPEPINAPHPTLPSGIIRTHESVLRCAEFKSALSGELAAYIRVHANAGARIRSKRGEIVAEPVTSSYTLGADSPVVVDSNVIFAEAHSSVTLVLFYDSADDSAAFHAGMTRVIAENCADVHVVEVQTLNTATRHFTDFSAVIANGASVSLTRIELGASEVYAGSHMKLEGDKAESRAHTFYFGDGARKLDFNYVARHLGQHSVSTQDAAGALFGRCDKIFRGTIDFVRGASGSVGAESENTLLFSKSARNRSAPLILCGEENVEGSHAASVGKPDAAKLYYMQSRGLSEGDAKRMLTLAMMETALKALPDEDMREKVRAALAARITDNA